MPPAIEEEEEVVFPSILPIFRHWLTKQEQEYGSFSEHTASSPQYPGDNDSMVDFRDDNKQASQQSERGRSPELVVSDIPLVVSDIPNGVTAPTPQKQLPELMGKGPRMNGKRKASPQKANQWVRGTGGRFEEDSQPLFV